MPAGASGMLSSRWSSRATTPRALPGAGSSSLSGSPAASLTTSAAGSVVTGEGSRAAPIGVRVAIRVRPLVPREAGQKEGIRVLPAERRLVILDEDRGQERSFTADAVLDSRENGDRSSSSSSSLSGSKSGQSGSGLKQNSRQGSKSKSAGSGESQQLGSIVSEGSQAAVYEAVGAELVRRALEGYNACLLAYGHTGSGKTYTMLGSDWASEGSAIAAANADVPTGGSASSNGRSGGGTPRSSPEKQAKEAAQSATTIGAGDEDCGSTSGLLPRTLDAIFTALRQEAGECVCVASFYEIHNERICDLLAPAPPEEAPVWQDGGSGGQPRSQNQAQKPRITVHFHPRIGAFVAGVEEVHCEDTNEALRLVKMGSQARTTAATALNERSSRSHAIFSLRIERAASSNSLMLVDLAGREQERLTQCRTERFKELTLINRSLFHLARCVRALAASQVGASGGANGKDGGQSHLFRNSKLTMVLGHALAGNSHTAVVGTISPARSAYEDSLATLRFCESVKQVRTRPALPVSQREDVVCELQDEVRRLEMELLRAKSGRAIVERQLGEAQAMMEHYRSSWQQALGNYEMIEKLRAEASTALGLSHSGAPGGSNTPLSSLASPRQPSGEAAPSTAPGSCSCSSAPSFWQIAEAGTGGPPPCAPTAEDPAACRGSSSQGDSERNLFAAGTQPAADSDSSAPTGVDKPLASGASPLKGKQWVPPLALDLVAEAASIESADVTRGHVGSSGSGARGDLASHRTGCAASSVDSGSAQQSPRSPASTGRGCRPVISPRLPHDPKQQDQSRPPVPQRIKQPVAPDWDTRSVIGGWTSPSSASAPRGVGGISSSGRASSASPPPPPPPLQWSPAVASPAVPQAPLYLTPSVTTSVRTLVQPMQLSGNQVQAPSQPDDELMRVCDYWLAAAEQSLDSRRHNLASTLRHLRSQLLDLRAAGPVSAQIPLLGQADAVAAAAAAAAAAATATHTSTQGAASVLLQAPYTPRGAVAPMGSPATPTLPFRPSVPTPSPLASCRLAATPTVLTPRGEAELSPSVSSTTVPQVSPRGACGWASPMGYPPSRDGSSKLGDAAGPSGNANACAAALGMLLSEAFSGQSGQEWQAAAAAAAAGTLAARAAAAARAAVSTQPPAWAVPPQSPSAPSAPSVQRSPAAATATTAAPVWAAVSSAAPVYRSPSLSAERPHDRAPGAAATPAMPPPVHVAGPTGTAPTTCRSPRGVTPRRMGSGTLPTAANVSLSSPTTPAAVTIVSPPSQPLLSPRGSGQQPQQVQVSPRIPETQRSVAPSLHQVAMTGPMAYAVPKEQGSLKPVSRLEPAVSQPMFATSCSSWSWAAPLHWKAASPASSSSVPQSCQAPASFQSVRHARESSEIDGASWETPRASLRPLTPPGPFWGIPTSCPTATVHLTASQKLPSPRMPHAEDMPLQPPTVSVRMSPPHPPVQLERTEPYYSLGSDRAAPERLGWVGTRSRGQASIGGSGELALVAKEAQLAE
eukprot:TRINITY_DN18914_c0_g1_i2.p1 TRINITY_DN18914_c0_g1~~TRINITY_DN18914_c0_g1_i2.p1  ORF type:complete len:1498 (+),score=262.60 TRINITY_DN18914_c0_g1_i2:44-4537(+)